MAQWYAATHKTWGAVLAESAARFPDREALICGGQRWTYAELRERVERFAAGLLALGVGRGDRVALWMTNCPEWVVAQFAVYTVGAVLLPVYTRFKKDEAEYALRQSESGTLIMNDAFLGKVDALAMLRAMCPELDASEPGALRAAALPHLRRVICLGRREHPALLSFEAVAAGDAAGRARLPAAAAAVDPFDVMNIIYTSGTTGFPKGGLSMHRNNLASIWCLSERMGLAPEHRSLCNLPLFSNFGCMFVVGLSLLRGAAVVLHETFDPAAGLRAVSAERITHLYGSPAMFISYLEEPSRGAADLGTLVGGIVGGSPLPPPVMDGIVGTLGCREMLHVYGLSECGGVATGTRRDETPERRRGTVGVALANARVKVTDPRSGAVLQPEMQGEICLGDVEPGSCVGKGYYNMPEKTREAIDAEGWFHTGDLGVLDADGFLRITGRVKDMFLVGGFNVYPAEVENVLHAHPKIKQAQVIGVPDHRMGEVCMAFVELREGERATEPDIIAFANERLSNFKVPRYVRFVTEFPLTGSGKVRKFQLREQAIAELGLTAEYAVSGAEHEAEEGA